MNERRRRTHRQVTALQRALQRRFALATDRRRPGLGVQADIMDRSESVNGRSRVSSGEGICADDEQRGGLYRERRRNKRTLPRLLYPTDRLDQYSDKPARSLGLTLPHVTTSMRE